MINRLTTFTLFCVAALGVAAQPQPPVRPLWKTAVQTNGEHELRRSYEAAGGTTWMLANAKPSGKYNSAESVTELLGFDANGQELARIDLDALFAGKDLVRFDDVALLADRNVALFVTNAAGELFAYTIAPAENRIVAGLRLGGPRVAHHVTDVVPAEDGRFLVIGRANARGWMMKLDAKLAIRWDKTFDDEPLTVFHDAAVRPDGSIVAAGGQLLETSQTNLWVGEITSEGQIAARRLFAGREASIALAPGRLAVVYDVKSATGWDVFVRGYADGLKEEFTTQLATNLRMPREYRISEGAKGEWIVAGPTKENRLAVTAFGPTGTAVRSWLAPMENELWERLWNVGDLALRGNDVVVPYTLLTLDDEKRQVQRIRLIRLPLRAQRQENQ